MMAIEQSLKTHLFIELFFRQRDSLLVEQTYNSKERKLLFEAYGVFPGFEDIAKSIAYGLQQGRTKFRIGPTEYINSKGKKKEYPLKSVEVVNTDLLKSGMAYMPKMTDFSPSGTIEKLYIYKASSLKDTEKIIPLLMHELTHAIEDYGLNQSDKRLDTELGKTGYFQYSQEKEDFLQSTINDLLYYFNYFETNAYIAQLSGELDQHRGYFETVNDILEYIKTLKVYKHYQKMFSYANELIGEKNIPDNVKQKILYIVSTNSKYKFTTYNRFVKFLKDKLFEIQRKFNKIVPKIAYNHGHMLTFGVKPSKKL